MTEYDKECAYKNLPYCAYFAEKIMLNHKIYLIFWYSNGITIVVLR